MASITEKMILFTQIVLLALGVFQSYTCNAEKYKLLWSDEFNGNSLNQQHWTYGSEKPLTYNNELQYYTSRSENVKVSDGLLHITALKEEYIGSEATSNYTSGKIYTRYKQDFLYGRFEARIKLVTGTGFWPAFWMSPTYEKYGSWARSGEIDIMEMIGSNPNNLVGGLYYGDYGPAQSHTGKEFVTSAPLADSYHIYAIEWDETEIRWYFDDIMYFNVSSWFSETHTYPAPFDKSFFITLNLAVGGDYPGTPLSTTVFPSTMMVDYVRVYTYSPSTGTSSLSTSLIVEIVIGVVLGSCMLAFLIFILWRPRDRRSGRGHSNQNNSRGMEQIGKSVHNEGIKIPASWLQTSSSSSATIAEQQGSQSPSRQSQSQVRLGLDGLFIDGISGSQSPTRHHLHHQSSEHAASSPDKQSQQRRHSGNRAAEGNTTISGGGGNRSGASSPTRPHPNNTKSSAQPPTRQFSTLKGAPSSSSPSSPTKRHQTHNSRAASGDSGANSPVKQGHSRSSHAQRHSNNNYNNSSFVADATTSLVLTNIVQPDTAGTNDNTNDNTDNNSGYGDDDDNDGDFRIENEDEP